MPRPRGATSDSARIASAPADAGAARPDGLAAACDVDERADARTPAWSTTHVIRTRHRRGRRWPKGPATWAMPRLASGTPPNGNEKRSASISECASGRPTIRHRPVGAASAAAAVERREHEAGDDVAGRGELPHPGRPGRQPSEPEQEPEPEPLRTRRIESEHDLEQRDAGERQWPPPPGRQRDATSSPATSARGIRARTDGEAMPPRHDGDGRCGRQPAGRSTWSSTAAAGRPSRPRGHEVEVGDDALGDRARRVAGEQRRRVPVVGQRDPHGLVVDDLDERDLVVPRHRCTTSGSGTVALFSGTPVGSSRLKITWSPGWSWSRLRKSALWLVRWPATTTLPSSPGIAVPGQWPGPQSSVLIRIPSRNGASSPIAGIWMRP